MKALLSRLKRDRSGGALIEMAFILPVFTFLTLAIFEFAVIFFYSFVLESAMYSVTRFAKVQTTPQAVQQEVRDRIGQLSLGLMDPSKVIITTELNVNFADDWENAPPEQCTDPNSVPPNQPIPGADCRNTAGCGGGADFIDANLDGLCNIGPPDLELGVPGAIVSYVSFYKKPLFTPGLGLFTIQQAGSFLNSAPAGSGQAWHLISSSTVTRNEPPTGP